MDLSIFDEIEQESQASVSRDPASLYTAFENVKDGRKAKGKCYPFALLLTLILLGKLAGEKQISGIVAWIKERKGMLKAQLNWPKRFPMNSTYSETLAKCSGEELAQAIAQMILRARAEEKCGDEPSRLLHQEQEEDSLIHTAMDGKTLRGTLGHASENQPPCICCPSMSVKVGLCSPNEPSKAKKMRSQRQERCDIRC